jgi:hypothetical protein
MARLLPILAVLAFALAYPRIALMLAVLVTTGTVLIVRWLMHSGTIFHVSRAAVPVGWP